MVIEFTWIYVFLAAVLGATSGFLFALREPRARGLRYFMRAGGDFIDGTRFVVVDPKADTGWCEMKDGQSVHKKCFTVEYAEARVAEGVWVEVNSNGNPI